VVSFEPVRDAFFARACEERAGHGDCYAERMMLLLLALACSSSQPPPATDAGVTPDSGGADAGVDAGGDCALPPATEPGVVQTDRATVRGVESDGVWGFRGIPYAAPPIGALRFAPPAPPACASEEIAAMEFGPACPQFETAGGAVVGSEDCLTLNVWSAALDGSAPILFFIHGGGNVQGSASQAAAGRAIYDGEAFARATGSVVITINYRLGPLGFMAHPGLTAESEHASSGNYGTLDQIAALEWVRRNAGAFGGDPARVLVFGESAGAVNTCMMVVSPLASGLFSAALMESGGCPARPLATRESEGVDLSTAAGCEDDADPIACLRALDTTALLEARPGVADVAGLSAGNYGPAIDGWVITEDPFDTLENGRHNRVPFAIGANSDETSRAVPMITTPAQYEMAVRMTFGPLGIADAVLAAYPVGDYPTPRAAYVQLTSDAKFVCGARRIARAAAAGQDEPVYRYHFTHALDSGPIAAFGAWHGLEVLFVFGVLDVAGYVPSAGEVALSQSMMGYWSRFGATGDPNGGSAVTWPEYDAALDNHLVLDDPIGTAEDVRTAQCDFWDSLVP
jgi:para-nitrobenzyl esterase